MPKYFKSELPRQSNTDAAISTSCCKTLTQGTSEATVVVQQTTGWACQGCTLAGNSPAMFRRTRVVVSVILIISSTTTPSFAFWTVGSPVIHCCSRLPLAAPLSRLRSGTQQSDVGSETTLIKLRAKIGSVDDRRSISAFLAGLRSVKVHMMSVSN
jgi:hypothetical protein